MMIDSHCHFDFDAFESDRLDIWKRCQESGLTALLVPGVEPLQWGRAAELSEQLDDVFYAVGLHPWWITKQAYSHDAIERELRRQSQAAKCIAIGECGLDALKEPALSEQLDVLRLHFELAIEVNLPVIIHCVKAHGDLLKLIDEHNGLTGVIHAYSGSLQLANEYWRRGFYLGAGGTLTYPRANKTRETFSKLADDAILLETDAPDMPVYGRRGQVNSPEYLPEVLAELARIRGQSVIHVSESTTQNFRKLFKKAKI